MNLYLLDFIAAAVVLVATIYFRSRANRRRRNPHGLPLPPGPKGLPLIGNVLDMPKFPESVGFAKMSEIYGDLMYVENIGEPYLFVNSYEDAYELLDRRSSNYSDRPALHMLRDPGLMNWDWSTSIMRYGDNLRKHRAFLHRFLQPTAIKGNSELFVRVARRFILRLLESPHKYESHTRGVSGAAIMMLAYGHDVTTEDDYFITLADKAVSGVSAAAVPGAFLVENFPILKYVPSWFPGAGFKKKARAWAKDLDDMLNVPYNMTKQKILDGTAPPSMMSQLLESCTNKDGQVEYEDVIAGATAIAYAGGSDTTTSSTLSFLLAMVLFPEVQRRGQEEIDRVVGKDRLPDFSDRPNLPYIEGIVQEALRWNPVVPLNIPHTSMKDDVYKGYFIPAGCQVIVNQWAILHDESMYAEPFAFKPERWLPTAGGAFFTDAGDVLIYNPLGNCSICPGKHFANDLIFIDIATILATLDLRKALDKEGKPITPTGAYKSGFLSHPEHFEFDLAARSPGAVALVRQSVESDKN